jgi:hypothetical protein
MQYLLMIYSEENGWNKMTDSERQQGVAAYQAYTESLKKAEVLVGANRLQHTSTATTVRLLDGKPQVLDGPYSDSKEQLAGYYLIDVPTWTRRSRGRRAVPARRTASWKCARSGLPRTTRRPLHESVRRRP